MTEETTMLSEEQGTCSEETIQEESEVITINGHRILQAANGDIPIEELNEIEQQMVGFALFVYEHAWNDFIKQYKIQGDLTVDKFVEEMKKAKEELESNCVAECKGLAEGICDATKNV